jgi:hypothetical protein
MLNEAGSSDMLIFDLQHGQRRSEGLLRRINSWHGLIENYGINLVSCEDQEVDISVEADGAKRRTLVKYPCRR